MKYDYFNILFLILLFSNVKYANQKKIYEMFHKLNIIFDFSNIRNSNKKKIH